MAHIFWKRRHEYIPTFLYVYITSLSSNWVYLQTQIWLGNKNIHPTDWGWVMNDGLLNPLKSVDPPAPQELLKMIFCNCKKGCGASCGCRKVGLFCNSTCGTCSGDNCQNSPPIQPEDVECDSDSDIES